ncbi:hypothetical protein [Jiella marina]|uniref:hypothetical protein n=1 Tax=Jiella sp. LLJ827 TaxID=2917712 RepID=UPI00210109C7|nr:hypothetical protein [Jiella sp. LLJ827]MCQ0987076.1 hypothetical protein [Jiella sp. LLJ827]
MSLAGRFLRHVRAQPPQSQRLFAILALAAVILVILAAEAMAEAYLAAFVLAISAGMGASVLLHAHRLTGGFWGEAARPTLEGLAATVPFVSIAGLALIVLQFAIYPWIGEGALSERPAVASLYLNPLGFGIRLVFILALWSAMAVSAAGLAFVNRIASGLFLALYAFTVNFAAIDWIMSLEPHWASTTFGALFAITQIAIALALLLWVDAGGEARPRDDLAKLTLASILGVVYMTFMQFLVQWSGNLPEKVEYYLLRGSVLWQGVLILSLGAAALAFVILSRTALRQSRSATRFAGLVTLVAALLFLWWEMAPTFDNALGVVFSLIALAAAAMAMIAAAKGGGRSRSRSSDESRRSTAARATGGAP